jgi:antitoxin (DNA-binding transcriptional repressor) of toxin-antitoxin stability system
VTCRIVTTWPDPDCRGGQGVLALLDDVAGGEEVEITMHGRIVARLVPARAASGLRGKLAALPSVLGQLRSRSDTSETCKEAR